MASVVMLLIPSIAICRPGDGAVLGARRILALTCPEHPPRSTPDLEITEFEHGGVNISERGTRRSQGAGPDVDAQDVPRVALRSGSLSGDGPSRI